mmetsp:Transcript_12357/g.17169  ORF Transcript_12357/g.17169 Transcript_12357/m.17169 type:complete len:574 (-) Transcript_12357:50-1771(-)
MAALDDAMWEFPGAYKGDLIKMKSMGGDDVHIRHGEGEYVYSNSFFAYAGSFKRNIKEGKGRLLLGDQDGNDNYYVGEFKNGQITGKGIRKYADGRVYKGDFFEGLMHGQGTLQDTHGEYSGSFNENYKEGQGWQRWKNGDEYEGEFRQGYPSGKGRYLTSSGELSYEGQWALSEKWMANEKPLKIFNKYPQPFVHSRCIGLLPVGQPFDVICKKDVWLKHEKGWSPMNDTDGEQLACLVVRRGVRHGVGVETEYRKDEESEEHTEFSVYKGAFFEDRRHGEGAWEHKSSGYVYDGNWINGKMEKESWFLCMALRAEREGEEAKEGQETTNPEEVEKESEIKGEATQEPPAAGSKIETVLSRVEKPHILLPEQAFEPCIVACHYDGSFNLFESGRTLCMSGKVKCEENDDEDLVFEFGDSVKEVTPKLSPEFLQTVRSSYDPDKPIFIVAGPVDVKGEMKIKIKKKPEPPAEDDQPKKVRRRKKASEKKEKVIEKLPAFDTLRVRQEKGCGWVGKLSFDTESLPVGTDIELYIWDDTDAVASDFKVSSGKKYVCTIKIVDEKTKAALEKEKEK